MSLDELINTFMEKRGISYTFYNKFANAYSFCYSYRFRGIKKNMSFIVMEKDDEIVCLSKFSMFNQKKFYIHNLIELEKFYDMFMFTALQNENLRLEGA